MRQYTDELQTTKLIELGFEKPKGWCVESISSRLIMYKRKDDYEDFNYSIGELLSFLPKEIDCNGFKNTLYIFVNQGVWVVEYSDFLGELYSTYRTELIDAIFDMLIKLK